MKIFEKTLKKELMAEGVGIHSGARATITLKPAPAGTGLIFKRTDVTDKDNIIYKFAYDQDVLTEAQNLDVIKHLIAKGYKINGKNLSPVLADAAIANDMTTIKYIVGKGLKYKNFDMTPALIATIE